MRLRPMPVVMVSTLTAAGTDVTLAALEIGAVDAVAKPAIASVDAFHDLIGKVKTAARSRVRARGDTPAAAEAPRAYHADPNQILAIGSSSGGVEALLTVLSGFPRDCPATVITQHMPATFTASFAARLDRVCAPTVTEAVEAERKAWQNRSLDAVYPIVYFDAIVVKVRQDGRVINKAIHLALGVNLAGHKELLGLWMTENESSKFWLSVLTELQNRGVKDIFIACVDGLTGFPEAIETVFPQTRVQLCIVHMVRNSLSYVSYKDRKAVAADLKTIYSAATALDAEAALMDFAAKWDARYPTISKSWMAHWERIIPFFAFPADIRKAIYTTNAIESLNMTLRKVLRNHRSFPTDESAMKVIFLAINNISKKWTMPIRDWKSALNRFAIEFEGRFPM
jgi:putative transposase